VVRQESKTFTVTNYEWMAPYAMLAVTKLAEEQGEWAAEVAASVLAGMKISDIPVVVNRHWNLYVNPDLLKKGDFKLSQELMIRAIKVRP
jgi:ABC-type uncharacterized transport system substrate-binding protein